MREKLETVVATTVTPFAESLEIDFEAARRNLDFLLEGGIMAIVPCGNTGEFYGMTVEEAKAFAAFTAGHVGGRATVVAGIGHDVRTATDLAVHAEAKGCDAVMVHHPAHPHVVSPGYADYVREIAGAVKIGVVLYVKRPNVADETLLDLLRIPNLIGVKYGINDLQRFGSLVAATPADANVAWVCGTAERWAPFFFAAGATGYTSGLGNVSTRITLRMWEALRAKDSETVRKVWRLVKPFEDLRERHDSGNNASVVKEGMHLRGLGPRFVRPPCHLPEEREREEVRKILETWKGSEREPASAGRRE